MSSIDIRRTEPHEYRTAAGAMATALLIPPPADDAWDRSQPSWDEMVSFSAWDGDRCVGHAGQFPVETTVPGGGRLATAAVARVGVLPTHRRRGIASGLMTTLIRDACERGQTLIALRASEATIYDRYGFGVAGDAAEATLDPRRARPLAGNSAPGTLRLLEPEEILDIVGPLYERIAHRRPGVHTRPPSWHRRYARAAIERSKAAFVAVHADADGIDDGYVTYEVAWNDGLDEGGGGTVTDLWAADDRVELALWNFLVELDLIRTWRLHERPVDDLVRAAAADRRAYQYVRIDDEQWLRLADVDVALATRAYGAAAGSVTIAVSDELLDQNNGTWRVSADGARQVDADADLSADIATLSAAYLGGTAWHALAAVGSVDVHTDGAIGIADALFASRPLPHSGTFF